MARVTFKKDQPVKALSGTVGALTFKTMNGKTFVFSRLEPELPKKATRKERAQYKQRTIVDQCVEILQMRIPDIREAIAQRGTLRARIVRLYKQLSPGIKAPTKLQKAIIKAYQERFEQ